MASVVDQEVAEELEKRQRGRGGTGGGAGGGVEREQEEVCSEEAKEANGEKEQEVEGQWRRGSGALKFVFRVEG